MLLQQERKRPESDGESNLSSALFVWKTLLSVQPVNIAGVELLFICPLACVAVANVVLKRTWKPSASTGPRQLWGGGVRGAFGGGPERLWSNQRGVLVLPPPDRRTRPAPAPLTNMVHQRLALNGFCLPALFTVLRARFCASEFHQMGRRFSFLWYE